MNLLGYLKSSEVLSSFVYAHVIFLTPVTARRDVSEVGKAQVSHYTFEIYRPDGEGTRTRIHNQFPTWTGATFYVQPGTTSTRAFTLFYMLIESI